MATKIGRMVTLLQGYLNIELHNPFDYVVFRDVTN